MYKLVYKYKETEESKVLIEKEYLSGNSFRLRRNAIHYLLGTIQNEYRAEGYSTEQITGGAINCYKSELTTEKKRIAIEWTICIKKYSKKGARE